MAYRRWTPAPADIRSFSVVHSLSAGLAEAAPALPESSAPDVTKRTVAVLVGFVDKIARAGRTWRCTRDVADDRYLELIVRAFLQDGAGETRAELEEIGRRAGLPDDQHVGAVVARRSPMGSRMSASAAISGPSGEG